MNSGDDEGEYTEEFKASLKRGMRDIREGRVYSSEEAKKILKIKNKRIRSSSR